MSDTTARRTRPGIDPQLPKVGDSIAVFGVDASVQFVEPQSDWMWSVKARTVVGEVLTVLVPTDYRTTDGVYAHNA